MAPLDPTTIAVYRFIAQHWQEHQFAPTQREIAMACYLSPTGVLPHLDRLEQDGYITREPGIARTIRIVKPLIETTGLTDAMYAFIVECINAGESPSQRELADAFGVSEQTIRLHLNLLEEAGRIQRKKYVSRSIILLKN